LEGLLAVVVLELTTEGIGTGTGLEGESCSGLEGMLAAVGLEEGIRTGRGTKRWRERVGVRWNACWLACQ